MELLVLGISHNTAPVALRERLALTERAATRFPAYEITTDLTAGRLRYVARARRLSTHPYLVMAASLAELTSELSSAQA